MRRIFGFIFLSTLLFTPILAQADFGEFPELVNAPLLPIITEKTEPPVPVYGSLPPPLELVVNPKEPPTLPPAVETPDCGDAIMDPGEECDDGNNMDGDGCSANCTREPACGDSIIDPGEACDDGNLANGDGCNNSCQKERPPPSNNNPPGRTDLPPTQTINPGIIMEGSGCSVQSSSASPGATYLLWTLMLSIPILGRKLFPHNQ